MADSLPHLAKIASLKKTDLSRGVMLLCRFGMRLALSQSVSSKLGTLRRKVAEFASL
jgi:hypothetical protein